MNFKLEGKAALVTGASQGLGRAIAKRLASKGVRLTIGARRKPLLEEFACEIKDAGSGAPQH